MLSNGAINGRFINSDPVNGAGFVEECSGTISVGETEAAHAHLRRPLSGAVSAIFRGIMTLGVGGEADATFIVTCGLSRRRFAGGSTECSPTVAGDIRRRVMAFGSTIVSLLAVGRAGYLYFKPVPQTRRHFVSRPRPSMVSTERRSVQLPPREALRLGAQVRTTTIAQDRRVYLIPREHGRAAT